MEEIEKLGGDNNMTDATITRSHLSTGLRQRCNLGREEAYNTIDVVLSEIVEILKHNQEVKIPLFGVFFARQKKERIGRNPRTLVAAKISARRVVGFRVSRLMKDRVDSALKKTKKS
jgi:integration host factor subunit alpha